jgi:EAL domain-containing protein (putative c-di-GMP-specific phosphodiesterase class I)
MRWSAEAALGHLTISVNVSARQFRQAGFVDQVQRILADSGATPQLLKLELTESLMVNSVQETVNKMEALAALGIAFSLDDFGTGYSSLSYLQRLPLKQLKIDQSFVRDLLVDAKDAAIAQTVINLAQNLGLDVIAEGVESAAQRDFLMGLGCHAYQGYFFGRPCPLQDFEQGLAAATTPT